MSELRSSELHLAPRITAACCEPPSRVRSQGEKWQRTPLTTATAFVAIVVFMDVVAVAMLAQRSFEMFASFLGTSLPFALIFASTYLTGAIVQSGSPAGTGL